MAILFLARNNSCFSFVVFRCRRRFGARSLNGGGKRRGPDPSWGRSCCLSLTLPFLCAGLVQNPLRHSLGDPTLTISYNLGSNGTMEVPRALQRLLLSLSSLLLLVQGIRYVLRVEQRNQLNDHSHVKSSRMPGRLQRSRDQQHRHVGRRQRVRV